KKLLPASRQRSISERRQRLLRMPPALYLEPLESRTLLSGSAALDLSTGDDFGNSFTDAQPITLADDGSGSQVGTIELPGDVDWFQFVAPLTGTLAIRQDAAVGSDLNSVVTVFDGAQQQIAFCDDNGGTPNSLVYISVTGGQLYYIQAAGYVDSAGLYVLTIA